MRIAEIVLRHKLTNPMTEIRLTYQTKETSAQLARFETLDWLHIYYPATRYFLVRLRTKKTS